MIMAKIMRNSRENTHVNTRIARYRTEEWGVREGGGGGDATLSLAPCSCRHGVRLVSHWLVEHRWS